MMKFLLNFFLMLVLTTCKMFAQDILSLDSAIEIGLKNNYGIAIARNETKIAEHNHSPGNAGFLPEVNLTAAGTKSDNNTKQKYSNGQEVNQNNVSSTNLNAGAGLSWTLFDGLKMFATSGKLKMLAEQGELNARIEIENTVFAIMSSYYDMVRIKQLIRSETESLSIYEERQHIAQTKLNIGSGSRQELLQTIVDKNSIRSSMLTQMQQLREAGSNLNALLARPAETVFDVTDSINISRLYKKEDLFKSVFSKNNTLQYQERNIKVASYSIKEYESQRMPKIGINANYNYLRNENKAGFSLYNQTNGFSYGFSASWNLFNGFNTSREVKNARLVWNNAKTQFEYTKNAIGTALFNAWNNFENMQQLLALEEENILLAKENLDISLQRFKLGASSILELKDAQNSYELAAARVISARYNTRLAEVQLMKLNGDLVK